MKIRVRDELRDAAAAEKGLLRHMTEGPEDRMMICAILDQTDLSCSVHERIFTAILELGIDSRRYACGEVQEILVARGDREAEAYLLNEINHAERPYSWTEALALASHLVVLAEYRKMVEDEVDFIEGYLD